MANNPGSLFPTMDVGASALAAERLRMNVIATNIANANVMKTPEGGPYKRRQVVFETILNQNIEGGRAAAALTAGVKAKIEVDRSPGETRHEPGNPFANENGDVEMPNVNPTVEMVDLMTAARSYEANLSAMKIYREMLQKAIQLGR